MKPPWGATARGAVAALCLTAGACSTTPITPEPVTVDGLVALVRLEERRPSQGGTETEVARVLYDSRDCPRLSGRRVEDEDATSCHKSLYHVAKDATILVDFDPLEIVRAGGGIRVRARLVGKNSVELPVENYTKVSKEELDVADPRGVGTDSTAAAKQMRDDIAAARRALVDLYAAHSALERAEEDFAAAYATQSIPETFARVRALKGREQDQIGARDAFRVALDAIVTHADGGARQVGGVAAARLSLERSIQSVSTRSRTANQALAITACPGDGTLDAAAMRVCVDAAEKAHPASAASASEDSTEAHFKALDADMTNLEVAAAKALLASDPDAVKPARVYLGAASTSHGDVLEIIVEATTAPVAPAVGGGALGAPPASAPEPEVTETVRFRLRLVDNGFSWRVAPQFALLRRFKDVAVATATAKPTNFEVTPGAALLFRWRSLDPFTDWLFPSFGIHAALPDFDPSNSLELGVGFAVGWLNEMVHVGVGWNLNAPKDCEYFFISLDFLATVDGFSQLTKKEGAQ